MYFIQTNTTKLERNSGSPNNLPAKFKSDLTVWFPLELTCR